MGKLSRTKGHSFERKIAGEFRDELGFKEARRQLEYHTRDARGIDIQNTYPFAVQCKRKRGYSSVNTIKDVMYDDNLPVPLLITQADRDEPIAVLYWEDLKSILKLVNSYNNLCLKRK